jgi:hypothetical protein
MDDGANLHEDWDSLQYVRFLLHIKAADCPERLILQKVYIILQWAGDNTIIKILPACIVQDWKH